MKRKALIVPAILLLALAASGVGHGHHLCGEPVVDMDLIAVADPPVVGNIVTVTVTVRDHLGTPLVGAPVTLWVREPGLPERIIRDHTGPGGVFEHQYPALMAGEHTYEAQGNWPGHIPGSVIAHLFLR